MVKHYHLVIFMKNFQNTKLNKEKTKPKLILSNCYMTIWAVILQMGENITAKYLLSFHLPKNCVLGDKVVSVHKESAIL